MSTNLDWITPLRIAILNRRRAPVSAIDIPLGGVAAFWYFQQAKRAGVQTWGMVIGDSLILYCRKRHLHRLLDAIGPV